MQTIEPIEPTHTLALASVEDAHNIGCFVRLFGESEARRAHYSAAIQAGGVVIRPCHLVVVDTSRDPFEVVWRIATRGTITALTGRVVTRFRFVAFYRHLWTFLPLPTPGYCAILAAVLDSWHGENQAVFRSNIPHCWLCAGLAASSADN